MGTINADRWKVHEQMTGNDVSADGTEKPSAHGAAFEPWPDWEIENIPALARYVSVAALDEIGLAVPDRYTQSDTGQDSGESIARDVYESIRELGLKYMHAPWRVSAFRFEAVPRQRVRYPAWVRRDSGGTCLDLAILYATALMRAQIRPYIAVMYDSRFSPPGVYGEREGHAFVVADLREPLTTQLDRGDFPRPLQPVETGRLRIQAGQEWPAYLLAIDPMYATTNFPSTTGISEKSLEFAQATAAAAGYLSEDIQLCDIASAQDPKLYPPLRRPADSATPAIWTRLPEMPPASRYPSREGQYDKLMKARGRIVIYGPQGFGKSTLAYARARDADGGYGWFLNAADRSTLQSELAQAEIEQMQRGYDQLEKADQGSFSDAALRRLDESDAPWVLVLDNANGDPGEIDPQLLPRTIGPNQTVIITTTNPAWLEACRESQTWPVTTHVVLGKLESRDMSGIDSGLHAHLGGSPLFYEAARAAVDAGARIPAEPADTASLSWQLAQDLLAGEPGALDLAHLIAWAPPVVLPAAEFAEFSQLTRARDGDPIRPGRLLEDAGLVRFLTRPVPAVLMHRLIAVRVRDDERLIRLAGHEPLPAPVALLAAEAGQRLMTVRGDDESFSRLEEHLGGERPARVPLRSWGLAVYGIARAGEIRGRSASSSALFEKAIDCLDETEDRSLLSECWNGRARYLKDHPPADRDDRVAALARAMSWAQRAQDLAKEAAAAAGPESRQHWEDLIREERARAMEALIIKTQARDIADPGQQKAQYARSLKMLESSENNRTSYLEKLGITDSPDMDRARFNLGGPCISLAKLSQGSEAEDYLRRGLRAYEEAKRIRVARHGAGVALPSIAACDNGIALIYLYGALMEVDPQRNETDAFRTVSPQTRMALLRRASAACTEALRDRTILSPADRDDGDAIKSDDLTIKIVFTRKLLSTLRARQDRPLSPDEARRLLDKVAAETIDEACDLGGIIETAVSTGD